MNKDDKKIVGFVASAFDFAHAGHILMLAESKQHCTHLIAGLHVNPHHERPHKNVPIETVSERYIRLLANRYVDDIVPYETESELVQILKALPIDVRFLGEEYRDQDFTGKELPIKIVYTRRQHGFSSSGIRQRVINANQIHDISRK